MNEVSTQEHFTNEKNALKALSKVDHEYIVTMYDEGPHFLVLELAQVSFLIAMLDILSPHQHILYFCFSIH